MIQTHEGLFADIDSMEPDAFARHLAEDVTMRFGNAPELHGRDACRQTWADFCQLVAGVHHDLIEQWRVDDATIAHTDVTYTRKDGEAVTVPVLTVYRTRDDGLITDYRIFLDLTPVLA
jgi:ketosteroid isomerase-like protein